MKIELTRKEVHYICLALGDLHDKSPDDKLKEDLYNKVCQIAFKAEKYIIQTQEEEKKQ